MPLAPSFWTRPSDSPGVAARLLAPLGAMYEAGGRARRSLAKPYCAPVPVISVGNLALGGQGKTPLVAALASWLAERQLDVHVVTRGYGGSLRGPHRVNPEGDSYRQVGDEALLLSMEATTWVARRRDEGVRAAVKAGAAAVLLDDAHQNPSVEKTLSLVAVDAGCGFGNGRVFPAGPLRESPAVGLARADAMVVTGDGPFMPKTNLPTIRARIRPLRTGLAVGGARVFAFAGIASPERFFETLRDEGAQLVRCEAFPDHHPYRALSVQRMIRDATDRGALLVTTEKDIVRIPPFLRRSVSVLKVRMEIEDGETLQSVMRPLYNL